MKVLLIGSGGREHALADVIKRSDKVRELYCTPGNGGIANVAKCLPIKADDTQGLKKWAIDNKIDWVVIGPELPLTLGLADDLRKEGIKTFGVNKDSAQLEGSKAFSKQLLIKYNIPTADYIETESYDTALEHLKKCDFPIVIKADGLAAGKGVYISSNFEEGEKALNEIFVHRKFGAAGNKIVIEEYLEGREISAFAFSDGETVVPLIYAQDYKKIYENDEGPNTGGMGSYTPVSFMTEELKKKAFETVLKPTIEGLKSEGIIYQGILYAGLMIKNDDIKVLEFNVRFGDPEAQVIFPLLKTDIIDIFEAIESKNLKNINLEWSNKSAICVVLASAGYPNSYKTGFAISGIKDAQNIEGVTVFHAGTKKEGTNILTSGGRVLNVVAIKDRLKEAHKDVYKAIEHIHFENKYFRIDIARKELGG